MGGAFGVVYARLRSGDRRPLTGLLDELVGMIALQYLGVRAARREQQRPAPAPHRVLPASGSVLPRAERDPLGDLPMRLTYRTARVLPVHRRASVGEQPPGREQCGGRGSGADFQVVAASGASRSRGEHRWGAPERRAERVGAHGVGLRGRAAAQRRRSAWEESR